MSRRSAFILYMYIYIYISKLVCIYYLVHDRLNLSRLEKTFDLNAIEVGHSNATDQPKLHQFLQLTPSVHEIVRVADI